MRLSQANRYLLKKDRSPYPGTGIADGREKLAILADATNITKSIYPLIEDVIDRNGSICLRRYFNYRPDPMWKTFEASHGFQRFRVDSFVPIHIQMIADAMHIADYRELNMLTGVAMVVTSTQGDAFAEYHKRFAWHEIKYYVFTEKGLHFEWPAKEKEAPKKDSVK